MFELLMLCALALVAIVALKIFLLIFKVSFWALTLPFQLLAVAGALLFVIIFAIPVGLVAGILGLLVAPLAMLAAALPFVLIAWGLYLLLRN